MKTNIKIIKRKKIGMLSVLVLLILLFATFVHALTLTEFINTFSNWRCFAAIDREGCIEDVQRGGLGSDPRITTWYDVEDWELNTCNAWGGTEHSTSSAVSLTEANYTSATTAATIQAEAELLPDGNVIYRISYYVQALEDMDFTIMLKNDERFSTDSGNSVYRVVDFPTRVNGGESMTDYVIINAMEDGIGSYLYDSDLSDSYVFANDFNTGGIKIKMGIDTDDDDNANIIISVPVVGEDYIGCTTGCGVSSPDDVADGEEDVGDLLSDDW